MDFRSLFRPGILNTRPYEPGKPVSDVQRELGLSSIVKLASNENPEGPLPAVIAAVTAAAAGVNRYPDGSCFELTHALAGMLDVDPKALILGNGSNEILDMLIRALVTPGENVVYSTKSFVVYPLTTQIHFECGRPVEIGSNFRYDLPAMAAACDEKTKLLIVCNPNNPSGTYNTRDEFEALLDSVPRHVIVVVDEAYYEYVVAEDYPQTLPMLAEHPNLVLLRTFSKIHSLAGLRVGYGVGHPDLIGELHKTREPFNVNMLAQVAAIACIGEADAVAVRARHNREWLEELDSGLRELGLETVPSQTNFILVPCPGRAAELTRALLLLGVIVRPMRGFGFGDDAIRISVGLPDENRRCLAALKEILE